MSIRQRIVFLVALVFATLALIGGYAVHQARSSSVEVRAVTEGVVPSAIQSVELMTQLKDVQIAALSMVAAPDVDTARRLLEELNAKKAGLQRMLDEQLGQADSHAQRGLIKEAQESLRNYFDAINDTAGFKLAGQTALAEATMGATVDQYLREQGQMIDAVQVEKRRSKDAAIDGLNRRLGDTTVALSVISAVAVLGLGVIGWLLYRQVVHPIGEMEAKMTEIATSQDFTHRLSVGRNDEIGRSMTAFNAMVERIEESTALVRQKAADIQALLQNIPQGILTVEAGGTVHPEYSAHLPAILGTPDIAGRDAVQLVLADADLSADTLAQAEAALHACIGEDAMNFDFNAHLLPTEIRRVDADGRIQVLELGWSPIAQDDGTLLRVMLCVRDVTELRALALAAGQQKRELDIIGEILAVQHEKFHGFVESARELIEANDRIVREAAQAGAQARASAVGLLFRNMHTVKGNARTYGLRHLADVMHRAEQTYDALRSGEAEWSTATLCADLSAAQEVLAEYTQINSGTLGRTGPGRRGDSEKFVLMARDDLQAVLAHLDAGEAAGGERLLAASRQVRRTLRRAGTERLEAILRGVTDSLPALAEELGKEPPQVLVDDGGIAIRSQLSGVLRNACMHLLRNAVDHGIEEPLVRIARGKSAIGHIRLVLEMDRDMMRLRLQDDGRGLHIDAIRQKAIAQGLLAADADPAPADVARLILAPGFSTAATVTNVSGRGVGMDAVQGFIEAEGGSVEIVLHGTNGHGAYAFETVLSLPAEFGVVEAAETEAAA
ncbi:HAMP domain-containing protein [uncultured Xylophilus sp.]|uniref:HAMP domain-containing protein n=1 Tax=uncultured Xylophilus sp. TaxID=296832 RepID=UPI0025D5BB0D|nr:HAMP domain-containing protein [uncultured Xylophilus sp.]